MKKLFLFLLLLFLVSNVVYAAKIPKKYLDENYVFKDDKKLNYFLYIYSINSHLYRNNIK